LPKARVLSPLPGDDLDGYRYILLNMCASKNHPHTASADEMTEHEWAKGGADF
jgi:hypothetical protein